MAEIVKISDQFQGLPMNTLIGAPLSAACHSQISLARATSDFINTVGFEETENGKRKLREVEFGFTKSEHKPDGTIVPANYMLRVPFISIVSVPTLQIDDVDITFDMEVKSSFAEVSDNQKSGSTSVKGNWFVKAKVEGAVSSSKETTRTSDNSAKYHVHVSAKQAGTPEGLSRVLDILQQSVEPIPLESAAGRQTPAIDYVPDDERE